MKVILLGYRCTGKSSVGRMLAGRLQVPLYDTDSIIEQRAGRSIRQMVAETDWSFFRQREKEIIGEAAAAGKGVVATGGGAVLDRDNREILKKAGVCIWLTADADTILRRMAADAASGEQRPPLTDRDAVREVREGLKEREPLYRELADLSIDTTDGNIGEIVERICRFLKEEQCRAIP